MKEILLTQGKVAIVDDEDFEWLNQWKWIAHCCGRHWYAESGPMGFMHRLILQCPKGLLTDHINGNGLDNRRCNLRTVDYSQNGRNRKCKGITWHQRKKKWMASLMLYGKTIFLGYFMNEQDALVARQKGEQKHFGEFAHAKN